MSIFNHSNNSRMSVGNRLYFSVLSIFIVFAIAFIGFQQVREKQYKIDTLDIRLQNYNTRMYEWMDYTDTIDSRKIDNYILEHDLPGLRLTIIQVDGDVVYDSKVADVRGIINHRNRPEVRDAIKNGHGSTVDRSSETVKGDFFYSATYFKDRSIVIRSALPYNNDLTKSLRADQHYIWFAIAAIVLLTIILYRFTHRLGANITKLRIFASRAAKNYSLETEDLADFPDDELGEIAERIIKIYKRLQTTRQEQDRLKRQLTQNIAHELKTPVASIHGYLETILENPHIDETMKQQFLQRCFAQSKRLTALLQDISTLNRMDDAPEMMEFANVDVAAMVSDIVRETHLQLYERNMTFDNRLPDHIAIQGNYSLLYSVFRNLTDNAIAYAGMGTTITLNAKDEGDKWTFTFADNGVGVPTEHLLRLFERFYRIDKGRSRKMGGTGLGLAIVKNSVLLHGGTIRAYNSIGGGLTFEFSLQKERKGYKEAPLTPTEESRK